MNEIWKTIKDFENYEISSMGRIKNRQRGKLLNPSFQQRKNNGKYGIVGLRSKGRTHTKCVHQLVAEAFLPPEDTRTHKLVHKNGDCADNRVENLEWVKMKYSKEEREKKPEHNYEDLSGQRFNLLVAKVYEKSWRNKWQWKCECDCGNIVWVDAYNLKHGRKSCGCYVHSKEHRQVIIDAKRKKGSQRDTLCWFCKHATNKYGKCPWSGLDANNEPKYQPVEGWDAVKVEMRGIPEGSYLVKSCPLYEEG